MLSFREILCSWVSDWSKKGPVTEKRVWKKFIANSAPQSCELVLRETIENPVKIEVETVVVWNGNGARARWASTGELKEVVRASDPDVLCFIESKTDVGHLLQLDSFENWLLQTGYKYL